MSTDADPHRWRWPHLPAWMRPGQLVRGKAGSVLAKVTGTLAYRRDETATNGIKTMFASDGRFEPCWTIEPAPLWGGASHEVERLFEPVEVDGG